MKGSTPLPFRSPAQAGVQWESLTVNAPPPDHPDWAPAFAGVHG